MQRVDTQRQARTAKWRRSYAMAFSHSQLTSSNSTFSLDVRTGFTTLLGAWYEAFSFWVNHLCALECSFGFRKIFCLFAYLNWFNQLPGSVEAYCSSRKQWGCGAGGDLLIWKWTYVAARYVLLSLHTFHWLSLSFSEWDYDALGMVLRLYRRVGSDLNRCFKDIF